MTADAPAALPETGCARLWLWPGQAVYVGPSLELGPHSGSVSCLAVGVDAEFTVRTRDHGDLVTRSALIAPRLTHQLITHGRMVFCYLDPASARERACRPRMSAGDGGVGLTHRDEQALAELAPSLSDPDAVARWLTLAAPARTTPLDPRIVVAARSLRERTTPALSAADLAEEAGLSTSRFLHLFRADTGTSFRRYRLWARMLRAGSLLRSDLTTAAVDAGFASPSHFSDSFHAMFGLTPTRMLAAKAVVRLLPERLDEQLEREVVPSR